MDVERSVEPLFVSVGRLMPHKRIDLLLRAWEEVHPVIGGRLVIVGDGPDRTALEAQAGAGVTFVGKVDEVEKWTLLRQAWALVHSAHHEGWGLVIMEAAAVGTPAVGFDVPGVRDAIVDGTTGTVVGSEAGLATALIEVATDEPLRRRLSEGALAHASAYGWDDVARRFADIAGDVVGQWGRAH
jgi:glycosyltransferase involved in cell wall biosynthesis